MKFPLPNVSEEDRGLLSDLRSKRKYEPKKASTRQSKQKEGDSRCVVTITVLCGLIITISTVAFTVMEIMNNRATTITAYPMEYHNNEAETTINIIQNENYLYPRISLEEVRAEIQRARTKEIAETQQDTQKALAMQQSWTPHDLPDSDTNTLHDIISTFFMDTEFYRRFRKEGDTEWSEKLSQSKAIYNDSQYNELPICLQMINRQNDYGFRNWRDAQVYYMAEMMSCTVAIHWGWIDLCPSPKEGQHDIYNIFQVLFYDNYNFAASHGRYNSMSSPDKYPPLHSFNAALAGRGHLMYDRDGICINGSEQYIDFVNEHIVLESGLKWPDKANKYDRDLNVMQEVMMIDVDIDKSFGELIGWYGAMDVVPVLKYYGLMVQHLRYTFRKISVDYVEDNWKDTFVIAYHIQMGNKKNNFGSFDEDIAASLAWLLSDASLVNINMETQQRIIVYISTDCGSGDALNAFMDTVRTKVTQVKSDIDVLLREQERVVFGQGHHMSTMYQMESMQKCVESLGDLQIDAELLGLSDVLILPSINGNYHSSFTRLSRALMMKRHKTICRATKPREYLCKNFESKQSTNFNS